MNKTNKNTRFINYQNHKTLLIHEKGLLKNGFFFIEDNIKYLFVVDKNILKIYQDLFTNLPSNVLVYSFDAYEANKSFEEYTKIIDVLLKNNFTRKDIIVSIGGGITSDISLFVASTYQRGMKIILIPTTLLSMVDASIGGKCGINYQGYKNQIGCFYFPQMIIIDEDFLSTLNEKEFNNGFSEIIKYALLFDEKMFLNLENKNYNLSDLIDKCINYKLDTIKEDLYDGAKRKLLNFGHTYGHILESISNYQISHGHAVAIGMYKEITNQEIKQRTYNLLIKYFDLNYKLDKESISKYLIKDKKRNNNEIDVVFLENIGKARLIKKKVEELVDEYIW